MNKIINTIGAGFRLMVCMCLAFLLIPACTNETEMITDTDTNAPLQVSAFVKSMAVTKADDSKPAAAGTYYMGYTKKGGGAAAINLTVQQGGNVDPQSILGKTWSLFQNSNPLQNTPFTLDNVADVSLISGTDDVLWGKTIGWCIPLNFVLDHKMSKLTIQLTTESADIDLTSATVTLINMATAVAGYNRATGVITAGSQDQPVSSFTAGDTDAATLKTSRVILPPQKRQSTMKLNVVIGSNTFESSLPNGMVYDGSSKQLEFLSGYHLTITAKLVKDATDNRILFTNATLENWIEVGTGSVTAKEAGIYNATDLTAWIAAYNASPQDEEALKRYGKNIGGVWTFSIWKNITLPSALTAKIQNFGTNNLNGHGYTITDGAATDKNLLFEATLPDDTQLKNITIGTTKYN